MSNSMMAAVLARLRNTSDDVGATERLVLVLLAESCRRGRITSPGVDEMIALTRVSDRRLRQAIATLAREDQPGGPWLRRVGGGHRGRRAEYELLPGSTDGTAPAEAETEARFRLCASQRRKPASVSGRRKGGSKTEAGFPPPVTRETSHPSGGEVSLARVRARARKVGGNGADLGRPTPNGAGRGTAPAGEPSPNADGITARTHPAFWRVTGRSDQPKHVNALCKIHSNVHEQRARPCPDCVNPLDPLIDLLNGPCDPHDVKACDTCMAAAAQRRWPSR